MMTRTPLATLLAVLVLALAPLVSAPAFAGDLNSAKAQGYVGERPDGYLGLVKSAPPDVRRLVDDINAKRRARYADIAKKRGTDRRAVEAIAGSKVTGQAAPGTYIMDASGRWKRK